MTYLNPVDDPYLRGLQHFVLDQLQADLQLWAAAEQSFQRAHEAYLEAENHGAVREILMLLGNLPK